MTVASLCSFAFCANTRERISAMPPAWVGTITRIGWSGKPWPRARCVLHNVELGRKRRCGQSERHAPAIRILRSISVSSGGTPRVQRAPAIAVPGEYNLSQRFQWVP